MGDVRTTFVSAHGVFGGAEQWLMAVLKHSRDRLDPDVILLQDGPFRSQLSAAGIPVTVHAVGRQPWNLPSPIARMARELKRRNPDVVVANGLKAELVVGPAARFARVPDVWVKHDHGYDRTLALPVGRLARYVVATAPEVAKPVRRDDVTVIVPPRPEAPPLPAGEARTALERYGLPSGELLTLGMAARLVPFKGVDHAITSLADPHAERWRIAVAGEDDPAAPGETRRLAALADSLGVSERVFLLGNVPQAYRYFAAFDAVAVLTRAGDRRAPKKEGFGLTALEAMLAGVPVVTVDGGAVANRVREAGCGVVVPPGDPGAVAWALWTLGNEDRRKTAGAAGRGFAARHPDAATVAAQFADVLIAAAAGRA